MKKFLLTLVGLTLGLTGFVASAEEKTDVIDVSSLGVTASNSSYTSYTITETNSGAEYALNCGVTYSATGTSYFTINNNTGFVNTKKSPGIVKSVSVNLNNTNKLTIFAGNTAYGTSKPTGTSIGSTSNTYSFDDGNYTYVAFQGSASLQIISLSITWEITEGGNGETTEPEGPDTSASYKLVSDISQIGDSADCIIVGENDGSYYAISTNQATNNRTATSVTLNDNLIKPGTDVAIINISKVENTNFYSLNVTNGTTTGYLYAAGTSGNYLRTKNTIDAAAQADIKIDASSLVASVVFQGTGTRNYLQFNYNNGSPLFTCYASASQKPVQIYVKDNGAESPVVATPQIFFDEITNTVSISCSTEDATIYYTTNGDEPSDSSTEYENSFTISSNTTVKAIAYVNQDSSNVASLSCTYLPTYSSYSQLEYAGENSKGKVENITVIYQNGNYLYTKDSENNYMLIFGSLNSTYTNGDNISYVVGTYSYSNNLPELINATLGETSQGTVVEPVSISLTDATTANLNKYIIIDGLTIATGNNNRTFTLTDGDNSATLYNTFNNTIIVPTGSNYTVEGFVSVYGNTIQITPISITNPEITTATFTFQTNNYGMPNDNSKYVPNPTSIVVGDIELTLGGDSGNSWRYYNQALRAYRNVNANFILQAGKNGTITKIEWLANNSFTCAVEGTSDNVIEWTGEENAVQFNYTADGNYDIYTIQVTYTPGEGISEPEIEFESTLNQVSIIATDAEAKIYYTIDGTEPTTDSTLYTEPFTITQTVTVKAIAVLNGETSSVKTKVCNYFETFDNYADFVKANPANGGKIQGPITAIYQNGLYLYTIDNKDNYMLIYGNLNLEEDIENGDQIAYIDGKYSPYQNLAEISPLAIGDITTGGTPVEPEEISLDEVTTDMVNTYVTVSGVTIENEGSNYTIVDGEDSLVLYNRFSGVTIPTPSADDSTFTIVGFISIYGSTLQLYPISFDETTGVNAIGSEMAGEEVYYNLQGMKVQNPVKGQIYIVNGKKVLVK